MVTVMSDGGWDAAAENLAEQPINQH